MSNDTPQTDIQKHIEEVFKELSKLESERDALLWENTKLRKKNIELTREVYGHNRIHQ